LRSEGKIALLFLGICAPRAAAAFADSSQFFTTAAFPHAATVGASGEGVYFTGAPRFAGLDCAACHARGPQVVQLQITADPPGLFSDGYMAGVAYEIEVALIGESLGLEHSGTSCTVPPGRTETYPYKACNNNSFAAEVDDADGPLRTALCAGQPSAGACPSPEAFVDETIVAPDGDAVFGNRRRDPADPKIVGNDPTSWRFWFIAPPPGTGPLTLYVDAVDGAGGDGTAADDQDVFGDDTVRATVPLAEAGSLRAWTAVVGCALGGAGGSAPGSTGLFLVGGGLLMLRRRRSRRLMLD